MKYNGKIFNEILNYLSFNSDNSGKQIFEDEAYRKGVEEALDEAKTRIRRNCRLKSPLVVWFVLMLIQFREISIRNISAKILQQFRDWIPNLSLDSITSEAWIHARKKLGSGLHMKFVEKTGDSCPVSGMAGREIVGQIYFAIFVPSSRPLVCLARYCLLAGESPVPIIA